MQKTGDLEQIVKDMGYKTATESLIYMNFHMKRIIAYNHKAESYPIQRFYETGHPRKLAIEKRNEHYNAIIAELTKWHDKNGNFLFKLPPMLRTYQESPNAIYDICRELLCMEHSGEMEQAFRKAL